MPSRVILASRCRTCMAEENAEAVPGMQKDIDSETAHGIPICRDCGGLGMQYDECDFHFLVAEIRELRERFCPHPLSFWPLPPPLAIPVVIELSQKVQLLRRRYGGGSDEPTFADAIAGEASLEIVRVLRSVQRERLAELASRELEIELLRPAWLAAWIGEVDQAKRLFLEASRDHPNASSVQHDYGLFLLWFLQDPQEALPFLSQACLLANVPGRHLATLLRCLRALRRDTEVRKVVLEARRAGFAGNSEGDAILRRVTDVH